MINDLTGQRFGKWFVVGPHTLRAANGGMNWRCKCECGQSAKVSGTALVRGISTQCRFCKGIATRKRYCIHGHDTEIWGRTNSQACRACVRDKHLRSHYGITLEDFETLYQFQNGLCAICKKSLGVYKSGLPGWGQGCRIEVDHEHIPRRVFKKSGLTLRQTVRGLLCGGRWAGCNRRIGRIDKLDWLQQVLAYLTNPPARQILGTSK
jgi:hypothetical protein